MKFDEWQFYNRVSYKINYGVEDDGKGAHFGGSELDVGDAERAANVGGYIHQDGHQ